jgi:CRP-like cAMP-binding protein
VRSPDTGGGLEHLQILTEKVQLFQGLSVRELAWILRRARNRLIARDELLFDVRQTKRHMYVILSGEVVVIARSEGQEERIALLGPGATVGEMTLIDNAPRSARAVTTCDTNVLEFNSTWLKDCPSDLGMKIYQNLSEILAQRLRSTNQLIRSMTGWPMSPNQLSEKLVKLGITGLDLAGIDATKARLSNADLRGVDLRGADFSGADMRGAIFEGADLRETDLTKAVNVGEGEHEAYWERVKVSVEDKVEQSADLSATKPKEKT